MRRRLQGAGPTEQESLCVVDSELSEQRQSGRVLDALGDRLLADDPHLAVELLVLKTRGDKILDRALSEVGGKGLFVKEIEEALLDGRADVAVHSMKDLPAEIPAGLLLAAVPEREDSRDALIVAPQVDARDVASR